MIKQEIIYQLDYLSFRLTKRKIKKTLMLHLNEIQKDRRKQQWQ